MGRNCLKIGWRAIDVCLETWQTASLCDRRDDIDFCGLIKSFSELVTFTSTCFSGPGEVMK